MDMLLFIYFWFVQSACLFWTILGQCSRWHRSKETVPCLRSWISESWIFHWQVWVWAPRLPSGGRRQFPFWRGCNRSGSGSKTSSQTGISEFSCANLPINPRLLTRRRFAHCWDQHLLHSSSFLGIKTNRLSRIFNSWWCPSRIIWRIGSLHTQPSCRIGSREQSFGLRFLRRVFFDLFFPLLCNLYSSLLRSPGVSER